MSPDVTGLVRAAQAVQKLPAMFKHFMATPDLSHSLFPSCFHFLSKLLADFLP